MTTPIIEPSIPIKPKNLIAVATLVVTMHGVVGWLLMNLPRFDIKPLPFVESLEISFVESLEISFVESQQTEQKINEPIKQFEPLPTNTTSPIDSTAQKQKTEKV
ncbi:hypothetical protein ACF3NV_04165 [Moraxella atlantae]|uniref:hypothetical protein n=1 Tax=Faucicola atlantae TaxID=34059 RepID=UPI0037509129